MASGGSPWPGDAKRRFAVTPAPTPRGLHVSRPPRLRTQATGDDLEQGRRGGGEEIERKFKETQTLLARLRLEWEALSRARR